MLRHLLPALALTMIAASTATAQLAADLRGRVTDPSGSAVANATIDLTQTATNTHIDTITSRSGDYAFTNVTPGVYQLDVTAPGSGSYLFKTC